MKSAVPSYIVATRMVHCDAEHNDTPRRVAGDADIVPEERLEVARLADLRQRDAKAYDRHHPPLSGPERIFAGGSDETSAEADCPALVQIVDDGRVDVGVSDAVYAIPVRIARIDRILGEQR